MKRIRIGEDNYFIKKSRNEDRKLDVYNVLENIIELPDVLIEIILEYMYYYEGKLVNEIRTTAKITYFCLSFDKKYIVCGYCDGGIRLLDINTYEPKKYLYQRGGMICTIICLKNKIITGSIDSNIRIWDLETNICENCFSNHYKSITCFALNLEYLASASLDGRINIWNLKDKKCCNSLTYHKVVVSSLLFLSDTQIISGSYDGILHMWDLENEKRNYIIKAHTDRITHILSLDRKRIVTSSFDKSLKVWINMNGILSLEHILLKHESHINTFAILPNFDIISSGSDNILIVWDISGNKTYYKTYHTSYEVDLISILPNDQIITCGYLDQILRISK